VKRSLLALLSTGVFAVSLAAGAVLPTVKTASNVELGKILVSSTGRTLYHFTSDTRSKVKCTGACAAQWPPLLVSAGAKPAAGPGLAAAKLGVLKRPDGKLQVTYNGFTLYRYAGDAKAGETNGEAVGDTWYAVSSAGKLVKAAVATTGGSSGSGYGSGYGTSTSSSYDSGY
jgi:predicted lipoprotein with Yx(FWY)xxD motif